MDYSICKASSFNADGLQSLLIIYDVCCQWKKKFMHRLTANPTISLPPSILMSGDITYAVGKFHLSAHIDECYAAHTLNYILGAGQIDGELMETIWGPLKGVVQTMRSMSLEHRKEAMDQQFFNHNWKKLISTSTSYAICQLVPN
ncbi:hypothetical protein BDY19DRAFT_890530 [Irpex rosettiformis]|uniref:Uncharacterized protein n=1 Tax=Irpex rosettiformis TaxID=378272 RepID=A0ACB8U4Z6_9APHY|nr:hypothetical protein BDY19DRAFT_890530 [Irpex rosettiformis]